MLGTLFYKIDKFLYFNSDSYIEDCQSLIDIKTKIKVRSVSDDFDEMIDEFKKMLNLDSDAFEVDFLFIPETGIDIDSGPTEKDVKGFKISYHFEPGMEKPDINIEGMIDEKKIREHLKNIDMSKYPNLNNILESKSSNEIDASRLSLDYPQREDEHNGIEPYTEITDWEDFTEIVLEIPGMEEDNVSIEFGEEGRKLIFTAENLERKYSKIINLPFESSNFDCELDVNNGIAHLKVNRVDKKLLL